MFVNPNNIAIPVIITTSELAELLKVNEVTIQRWCRQRKIPFYRSGSDYRFDKNEVLRTLKNAELK
jgi:excisionase family DNA binding protein